MEPTSKSSQILGKEAEDKAVEFLIGLGYTIVERNWRYRKYEVDIIATYGGFLVFVEVKARSSAVFCEPEMFVDRKKQKFLIAAANAYLEAGRTDMEARFDIISVLKFNNNLTVKHLERAFFPLAR